MILELKLWRVKESLGEYGSGWEWDSTWPKVFDYEKSFTRTDEHGQTYIEYYPARYNNSISTTKPTVNGAWVGYGEVSSKESSGKCSVETTNGEILNSGSVANNNVSCEPHTYNAGNYYNLPSQLGDAKSNSVCPLGWKLPDDQGDKGYPNLLQAYEINYDAVDDMVQPFDSALINQPLSFLRSGFYRAGSSLDFRGSYGRYRMTSHALYFHQSYLNVSDYILVTNGYSVRCVAR